MATLPPFGLRGVTSRAPRGDVRPEGILSIRGSRDQAPSSLLIQGELDAHPAAETSWVRAGVAVVFALADEVHARATSRGPDWDHAVAADPGWLCARTGLDPSEVQPGLDLLLAAAVVSQSGEGLRIATRVICELPTLARLRGEPIRLRLQERRARVAPALAVARDLARRTAGEGWVEFTLADLMESTRYGRTAVSQALSALQACAVLERATASRSLLQARLTPAAFDSSTPPPPSSTAAPAPAAGDGVLVEAAGTHTLIRPGAHLVVDPGLTATYTLDASGRIVLRITPTA